MVSLIGAAGRFTGLVRFAGLPLLALPVLAYNITALTLKDGFDCRTAPAAFEGPLLHLTMTSGAPWAVSGSTLLLTAALALLFIELLRSTGSGRVTVINHGLSLGLLVICLVEFLLAPAFATSTFFLLILMALLDVMAGFSVTIMAARRDIDLVSGADTAA